MNTDERAQLVREIDALQRMFASLRLADFDGKVRTSRSIPNPQPNLDCAIRPVIQEQPQSFHSFRGASVRFNKSENENWVSWTLMNSSGKDRERVWGVIHRTSSWLKSRSVIFEPLAKGLIHCDEIDFGDESWPEMVHIVAECGNEATMKKPVWIVQVGEVEFATDKHGKTFLQCSTKRLRTNVAVELWRRRSHSPNVYLLARITKADEAYIGDPPREVHFEQDLDSFVQDSELTLDWLRRWVEGSQLPTAPKTGSSAKRGNKKKAGRRPARLTKEERKVEELWSSGNFKKHNDIDERLDLDWGTTAKILNRLTQRKRRKKVTE